MLRTRVMPCLLLRGRGLVKTIRFRDARYVGDPVNTVRIFNEKEVDELVFLDVAATPEGRPPNLALVEEIASECFMPFAYGGGLRSLDDLRAVFAVGVEKAVVGTRAVTDPAFVRAAADAFGSQSVVVAVDVRRGWLGREAVVAAGGRVRTGLDPVACAVAMAEAGAGELLLTSVDRDGTMAGYDLDLIRRVAAAVDVPVVASGGAGALRHFQEAVAAGASAVAAGSLFVYQGANRSVLVNYPARHELEALAI